MLILPDFVPAATVADLLAASAAFTGPRRGSGTNRTDCRLADFAAERAILLAGHVRTALSTHYPHLPPLAEDYTAYTTLGVGGGHPLHADAQKADGSPNHTPHRLATAMLYLGDEGVEFAGGGIHFPGVGVRVRPTAGTLVGFLCDWRHRHEVPLVARGVRESVAFWYRRAE